jgi:hypothetical protein
LQTLYGDIVWAVNADGKAEKDALVTGCSSIYKSLECACYIAKTLGFDYSNWSEARIRLGHALRYSPERFDRTWKSKSRYAMDWFYPVLSGLYSTNYQDKKYGLSLLNARWDIFVEYKLGCRCVSDEPWITVAESCELVMALLAIGDKQRAIEVYSWPHYIHYQLISSPICS